jgi:DNA end-binding protein Ku
MAAARRAYWKGYLKLSLVTCPIALYPASSQAEKTHFHQINRKTGHRLRQQMVDEETGRVVDKDDTSRGYEVAKRKYVEIEPDEIKAIQVESTHTLDIEKFVPVDEIDRRYFDRPYYIVPDGKAGEEAFAVIRDAMKDKDRVALAKIVLTNREHVMAIEPMGKGLLGTILRYDYEVRDEKDLFRGVPSPKIPKESAPFPSQDERRDAQFHPDHLVEPGRHAAINALHQPGNGVFRSRENLLLEHVIQIGEPPAVVIENGDRSLAVGFRPELGVGRGLGAEHLVLPHDHLSRARIFGLCCRMNATSVSTVSASHR